MSKIAVCESEQNTEHNRDQAPTQTKYPFLISMYLQKIYSAFFDVPDRYKVPLGELLVSHDIITEEQLQKVLLIQLKSARKYGQKPHLGRVLVDHGFTSEAEIIKAVNEQYGIQVSGLGGDIELLIKQRSNSLAERIVNPRLTIGAQLFLAATLLIILVSGMFSYVMLDRQQKQLYDQTVKVGMVSLRYFQNNAPIPLIENNILDLNTLIKGATATEGHLYAMIIDADNQIKAHTDIEKIGDVFPGFANITDQSQTGDITHFQFVTPSGQHVLNLTAPISFQQKKLGQVHVGLSIDFIQEMIRQERKRIVFMSLVFVGFTGLITLLMGLRFTRPIAKLLVATKEIGCGNFNYRVDLHRNDELQDLAHSFNRMSNQLRLKALLQDSFGKYVGHEVLDMLITQPESQWMKGYRIEATILFADVRGFTSYAENTEPEVVIEDLNRFLEIATQSIREYDGFIDKFIGDAVLAVFGLPPDIQNHEQRAVQAALAIQARLGAPGMKDSLLSSVGIGLNAGSVVAGTIGSQQKMDYTVIGDSVNVASRLCDLAAAGDIIISQSVRDRIGTAYMIETLPPQMFKGRSHPVHLFKVTGQVSGS